MHKLKCLIFIICFTSMHLAFADSLNDSVEAKIALQKAECDKNSSAEWSSKLSRCVGKKAAIESRNAALACDAMTDLEAKKKCNLALAEQSTGLSSSTGSLNQGNTTSSMVMNGAATAYAAASIITSWGADRSISGCTSRNIFATTAIGGLSSDVYLKMKAKKAVDELEGKYSIDTKSTATEAQVKALQYLKDEQLTVADIAGLEKKRNLVLMLGYGLASGWAVYEMATTAGGCVTASADKTTKKEFKPSEMFENLKNSVPENFEKYLDTSFGIATLSGIATVYSGILYKAADQQEQDSNANAVKVDKMIKTFTDSGATSCLSGRDNMANAQCYCYTDKGEKNTSRTNSQTCIDLWAKNEYKLSGNATNYSALTYNADVAGCVTVDNQFDENCKCKKLISSSGANACKKETSIALSSSALSTGIGTSAIKTLSDYTNNATNGNPRFDLLNSTTLGTQAIKASRLAQEIATKIPSKEVKYPLVNESNVGKYANAVIGQKALAAASSKLSSVAMASAGPKTQALENMLKEAQAKVGIDITGSGKGLSATKEKKKNGIDLNFGNESSSNSGGQVIANFPEEKNYKFKNSDIVTDNSTSIFEIISNRYIQSGLKRLFDEEATK